MRCISHRISMMIRSILVFAVLSTFFLKGQSSNLGDNPQNAAARLNDTIILPCHIQGNSSVIWEFYEVGKTRRDKSKLISKRWKIEENFEEKYSLNRTLPGQNDLVVKRVKLEDAGIYECTRGPNDEPSAHLNILETEPVCRVLNMNGFVVTIHRGDTVQLSCVVTLTGHCQPVMEWSLGDGTVIVRSASPDGNSESRTVTLEKNFTVTLNRERISLTSTISLACPPNKFHFNDLSSINPEYKHVDNSFEIRILDSTGRELSTLNTSTINAPEPNSNPGGKDWIIYMNVLLGLLVVIFIIGTITRMVIRKRGENERRDNMALRPYLGAASLSQPSEYFEIEIPDSIHSEESVTVVNPGRGTLARAAAADPISDGTGVRLTEVSQGGVDFVAGLSTVHPSAKRRTSRPPTTTLPNQQKNKNYVELDSSMREDRSAPSVYKRLNNKLVQSSPVTNNSEVEEGQHYCNVNRPRLPTPESNNSVESNMDQLAA